MHTEVVEGQLLAGKYRIDRVLGQGGMGVVVAAHHLELGGRVALKFLLPEALGNPEAVARFKREARAAARIKSEHVVGVTDVGSLASGAPYMVMEYLEGMDLSAWLRERGTLPIEEAVDFLLQACVAVADAHALGIIHRDLKPANLFRARRSDGQFIIKVLDFGISKLTDGSRSTDPFDLVATKTSAVMGSPLYMSPEQLRNSKNVDARSDIWALGVVLFELVTGSAPFSGESSVEVAINIATAAFPPLSSYRPHSPPGLDAVLGRCLEKDRERRYGNVAEFALALLPFAPKQSLPLVQRIVGIVQAAGLSPGALAVPPSPEAQPGAQLAAQPPETAASWVATGASRNSRKVVLGSVALVALALVALGLASLLGTRSPPSEPAAGPAATLALAPTPVAARAAAAVGVVASEPSPPGPPSAGLLEAPPPAAPQVTLALEPTGKPEKASGAPIVPKSMARPRASAISAPPATSTGKPSPPSAAPAQAPPSKNESGL